MTDAQSLWSRARSPRRRIAAVSAAGLVVAAAVAYAYLPGTDNADPAGQTLATVTRGTVERTVTALGSVQPKRFVDVGTQVSGQLRALHVQIGDRVAPGDLLAEIDPTPYEVQLRVNRARLSGLAAQRKQQVAELELARQRHERNRALSGRGAVSADMLQETAATAAIAEGRLAALDAQIQEAESSLVGTEADLGYTRIVAPMAGTVVDLHAVPGQTLNANQTAPIVLRIADLELMTVKAQVAEADINRIGPGSTAWFSTLGLPERRWHTTVRQVLPTPERINDVILYSVLMDVENDDGVLMTDMSAQVFFTLERAEDVPLVPLGALRRDPGSAGTYVERMTTSGAEYQPVEIGVTNRSVAEVRSGLNVGDQVVTGRSDGQRSSTGRNQPNLARLLR